MKKLLPQTVKKGQMVMVVKAGEMLFSYQKIDSSGIYMAESRTSKKSYFKSSKGWSILTK